MDRITAFLGKQTSGASIPDNILNDMAQLHQSIAANAGQTYGSKLKVINQNYGSSFKPVDMSGPSACTSQLPSGNGKTIDKATARQFYEAAGNDPNKARQLADEAFERFIATQETNATHSRELRMVFVAFLLDEQSRMLLEEGRFAELRARDASLYSSLSLLAEPERRALIGSLQSQVPLKDFEQAA